MGHNGCWGVMLLRNGSDEEGVPMYGYGRTVEELSWATEVRRKRCPNALLELATLYGLEDAVLESGSSPTSPSNHPWLPSQRKVMRTCTFAWTS